MAFLLIPQALWAHPFHGSYAELEWSEGGTLDVAMKVIPEDLERALTSLAGTKTVLRDTPAVRALLVQYLDKHFRVLPENPSTQTQIVGMELDHRDTWIYFSIPATPKSAPRLRNTVLMDLEATQTNRVKRLWLPEAPVLVFSAAEPERDL